MPRITVEVPIAKVGAAENFGRALWLVEEDRKKLKPLLQEAVAGVEKMHRVAEQVTVTFVPVFADFVRASVVVNRVENPSGQSQEDRDRDADTLDEVARRVKQLLTDYYKPGVNYLPRVTVDTFDPSNHGIPR